jgi:hypothetical protein
VPIAAGIAVTACDSIERPAPALGRESSQIVYSGTDQRVSEGFAIALRIMGVDASFLPASALATNNPNTKDN